MYAHIYMHVLKQTKINCFLYAGQTELLTQKANKESTEINIFSTEKTPNTKPGTWVPPNTNNTYNYLLCLGTVMPVSLYTPSAEIQWEQARIYQESFVSFEKRRRVCWRVWCTQEGHGFLWKAIQELSLPGVRAASILCCCSGTTPASLLTQMKHQGQ